MPIVVVGNVFVDFKGFPEGAYIPAGRNAGRVEIVHGGVGRNVAEDISNVELRPRFVSMVDNTAQGAEVLRNLQNHKVDTKFVAVVPDDDNRHNQNLLFCSQLMASVYHTLYVSATVSFRSALISARRGSRRSTAGTRGKTPSSPRIPHRPRPGLPALLRG